MSAMAPAAIVPAPRIAAEVIDRPPATDDERLALLELVRDQFIACKHLDIVLCPCGNPIPPPYVHGFRCYYCHVIFCGRCGRRHFGAEVRHVG